MLPASNWNALTSGRFQSRDDELEGIPIRYWESGADGQLPCLLLLHGSGPGASTHGNWRLVLGPLSDHFHVIATDLIGFGESGRKPRQPYFDYDLWLRQAGHLLGKFGSAGVNVLGHSLSGALALKLASVDGRVRRVMTTGTLGTRFESGKDLETVWSFPETVEDLVRAGRILVHDPALITDAYIAGRKKVLYEGDYRSYFMQMFAGDKQRYVDAAELFDRDISAIRCPVLLVHGRDDRPTPSHSSRQLAQRIKQADLVELAQCGHSIALEYPAKLVELARSFFVAW